MNRKIKQGIIFSLITAFISGFSIFYNKLILIQGVDPSSLNIIKNGGVAIIFSILILLTPRRKELLKLNIDKWFKLLLIAVVGGSVPFMLYFEGLKEASAVNADIIHKSMFIWVALMAIPIFGEKLNLYQIIGYILVLWSNLFIGGFGGFSANRGELLIFAATILWSVENIIAKIALSDMDAVIIGWGRMALGVLIIAVVALFQNKLYLVGKLSFTQFFPIFLSIIFLTGYVYTWYKGLKFASATVVTSVLILATPITNLLSALFINHTLPHAQITNLIITLIGISLILYLKPKLSHAK